MRIIRLLVVLSLMSSFLGLADLAPGQQSGNGNDRKVLKRIDPHYPELAKRIGLEGTVKVFAVVAIDGSVTV